MCVIHKQHIFENWIQFWFFFSLFTTRFSVLGSVDCELFSYFILMPISVSHSWFISIDFCLCSLCVHDELVFAVSVGNKYMWLDICSNVYVNDHHLVPYRYMMVMFKYKVLDGLNKETMSVIDCLKLMICILSNQPFDKNERTFVHYV